MANFCFYHGQDQEVRQRLRRAAAAAWGPVDEITLDAFSVVAPSDERRRSLCEAPGIVGAINGYVRCDDVQRPAGDGDNTADAQRFVARILEDRGWPLGDEWTGSFGAVAYSAHGRQIVLCNDPIGHAPLYFAEQPRGLIGGTSLIVLSRAVQCEVDVVGVLQRITPPTFVSYGRRTLLHPFSRLLPGEWRKWSAATAQSRSAFDNSLCGGLVDAEPESVARMAWECLQRETSLAVGRDATVAIAMSGGWDSRLVLGAAAREGRRIDCYTYGNEEYYESIIARRCAEAIGARHRCFPIEDKYFPSRDDFENLVRQTESANYMEWVSIIDAVKGNGQEKSVLLLGDLSEALDGRYITTLSSRRARREAFLRGLLRRTDPLPEATPPAYVEWKDRKRREITDRICASMDRLSPHLAEGHRPADLADQVAGDLELSFSRVQGNMPAFAVVFDEIFEWFHYVRFMMANQLSLLGCAFWPRCPGLSMRSLRLASRVHPRLRTGRRLIDALARLPDLDRLARVPSAQIPWLSARSPSMVRQVVWGMRSGLDQALIRAILRSKDARRRQRVLRSLDFIREYRRDYVEPTVRGWFSERWIRGEAYVRTAKSRAELTAWPLINVDISAPANVSVTLDLCALGEASGRTEGVDGRPRNAEGGVQRWN